MSSWAAVSVRFSVAGANPSAVTTTVYVPGVGSPRSVNEPTGSSVSVTVSTATCPALATTAAPPTGPGGPADGPGDGPVTRQQRELDPAAVLPGRDVDALHGAGEPGLRDHQVVHRGRRQVGHLERAVGADRDGPHHRAGAPGRRRLAGLRPDLPRERRHVQRQLHGELGTPDVGARDRPREGRGHPADHDREAVDRLPGGQLDGLRVRLRDRSRVPDGREPGARHLQRVLPRGQVRHRERPVRAGGLRLHRLRRVLRPEQQHRHVLRGRARAQLDHRALDRRRPGLRGRLPGLRHLDRQVPVRGRAPDHGAQRDRDDERERRDGQQQPEQPEHAAGQQRLLHEDARRGRRCVGRRRGRPLQAQLERPQQRVPHERSLRARGQRHGRALAGREAEPVRVEGVRRGGLGVPRDEPRVLDGVAVVAHHGGERGDLAGGDRRGLQADGRARQRGDVDRDVLDGDGRPVRHVADLDGHPPLTGRDPLGQRQDDGDGHRLAGEQPRRRVLDLHPRRVRAEHAQHVPGDDVGPVGDDDPQRRGGAGRGDGAPRLDRESHVRGSPRSGGPAPWWNPVRR